VNALKNGGGPFQGPWLKVWSKCRIWLLHGRETCLMQYENDPFQLPPAYYHNWPLSVKKSGF